MGNYYAFWGLFLRSRYRIGGGGVGVAVISKLIIFRVLEIPDIFGGEW